MDMPTGLYFCTLKANGFTQTRKMVLVKWNILIHHKIYINWGYYFDTWKIEKRKKHFYRFFYSGICTVYFFSAFENAKYSEDRWNFSSFGFSWLHCNSSVFKRFFHIHCLPAFKIFKDIDRFNSIILHVGTSFTVTVYIVYILISKGKIHEEKYQCVIRISYADFKLNKIMIYLIHYFAKRATVFFMYFTPYTHTISAFCNLPVNTISTSPWLSQLFW